MFALMIGRRRHGSPVLRLLSGSIFITIFCHRGRGGDGGVLQIRRNIHLMAGECHVEMDFRDHGIVHLSDGGGGVVLFHIRHEPIVSVVGIVFQVEDFTEALKGRADDLLAESVPFDEDRVAFLPFPFLVPAFQVVSMDGAPAAAATALFGVGRVILGAAADGGAAAFAAFSFRFSLSIARLQTSFQVGFVFLRGLFAIWIKSGKCNTWLYYISTPQSLVAVFIER